MLAAPVVVLAVLLLGPLVGYLIAGSLLVALPLLLRRRASGPRPGPGAAGPGEPGYRGSVHVGDDPGLVE